MPHQQSVAGLDERGLRDVVSHQVGHLFGQVHPHDLAKLSGFSAPSTMMSYTDGKFIREDKGVPAEEGLESAGKPKFWSNFPGEGNDKPAVGEGKFSGDPAKKPKFWSNFPGEGNDKPAVGEGKFSGDPRTNGTRQQGGELKR